MPASPATTACSRRSRPTPASAGTRWPPARIPPSTAPRTTPSSARATRSTTGPRSRPPACSRRTPSPTPPNARARRSPRSIGWPASPPNIQGPTVDFTNFFSNRGVLVGAADPVEQAGSAFFGVTYQPATVAPASGWSDVPLGDPAAPPKQTTWLIPTTVFANDGPGLRLARAPSRRHRSTARTSTAPTTCTSTTA